MRKRMTIPVDWRRPNTDTSYDMYWDDVSQFGMLYPRPGVSEIASFYELDNYYTHKQQDLRQASGNFNNLLGRVLGKLTWSIDHSVRITPEWFTAHHGAHKARVLDVGCGAGQLLSELQAAGHDVIGIEPDPAARKVAIERGVTVFDGTAETIPAELQGQLFDAVLSTHVLEHCVDPVVALRNASALLKPGGKLTVETPNHSAIGFQNAGLTWRWLDVPRHLNFFTPESLSSICALVGLTPVATEFRGYTRQFDANWIADEQRIWDRYKASLNGHSQVLPRRKTQWQAWQLFSRTLFASDAQKYDSVRIIAQKI